MPASSTEAATFSAWVELASARLGSRVLLANDEFFAEKENLLKPAPPVFRPDEYTDRGKWMDGWETRRRRTPGHDWCIIQLGLPATLRGFDIDTTHFLGNHPPYASVDAIDAPADATAETLVESPGWREVVTRAALKAGSPNAFAATDAARTTHLRLNIYPDGGVARFRAYGRAMPDWSRVGAREVDLAGVENGGLVVAASDMFFGSRGNLILPGRSTHMGDGWETRRRRGPGFDWAVVALGAPGHVQRLVIETTHFKGNYPDSCMIEACHAPEAEIDSLNTGVLPWRELLPQAKLRADAEHVFESGLSDLGPVTHVRLNIYPDGGVARLRVWGTVAGR